MEEWLGRGRGGQVLCYSALLTTYLGKASWARFIHPPHMVFKSPKVIPLLPLILHLSSCSLLPSLYLLQLSSRASAPLPPGWVFSSPSVLQFYQLRLWIPVAFIAYWVSETQRVRNIWHKIYWGEKVQLLLPEDLKSETHTHTHRHTHTDTHTHTHTHPISSGNSYTAIDRS
jgi:ABC-type nickel/cobalt efflux system permease component RcnA